MSTDEQLELAKADLLRVCKGKRFKTILADPPWQFENRTGKIAPEHKRLNRYGTMTLADIKALPVADVAADAAHLYMWVPNALLPEGIEVLRAWGFKYKSIVAAVFFPELAIFLRLFMAGELNEVICNGVFHGLILLVGVGARKPPGAGVSNLPACC